ncbi:MAG: GNAT family N-acetyltransferase [Pseudomonadales bacterium]
MKLRTATTLDFDEVMKLYRQLQPNDPVLTNGKDRATFNLILDDDRLQLYVVEGDSGKLTSSCYLNIIPNITRSASPYGVIENVITEASLRGNGLGKRVVHHALDAAWSAGCYKVMLQTGSNRESTHAFYRACGFSGDDKQAFVAWRPGWTRP